MDSIDHAIIDELRRDGRLANVELAERVNLSPSPCLRRVRALEQAGVIRGYHADVDPAALGRGLQITVLVELTHKDRATVEEFERRIALMEPVLECRRMFGIPDYIIDVAVADTRELRELVHVEGLVGRGVGRVSSQFTMKLVKSSSPGAGGPMHAA